MKCVLVVFIIVAIFQSLLLNASYQEKKKVIIIGCSSGIGRELVRVFTRNGYSVGGISRNQEKLALLYQEVGESFCYALADVRQESSRDVLRALIETLGGCDICIINAGVWSDGRVFDIFNLTSDSFDWNQLWEDQKNVIETNITGFVRMASVALKHFTEQKKGHLVGISSVDAVRGNPWGAVYSASKAFESHYMQAFRSLFEMALIDIHITDIRPGFIATYDLSNTSGVFWVEPLDVTGQEIFNAIQAKQKIAYITNRWEKFATYLTTVPDTIYNFMASNFSIR